MALKTAAAHSQHRSPFCQGQAGTVLVVCVCVHGAFGPGSRVALYVLVFHLVSVLLKTVKNKDMCPYHFDSSVFLFIIYECLCVSVCVRVLLGVHVWACRCAFVPECGGPGLMSGIFLNLSSTSFFHFFHSSRQGLLGNLELTSKDPPCLPLKL